MTSTQIKYSLTLALALCLCMIGSAKPQTFKPHPNVHVAILGDSNTWLGGDDCSQDKAWSKWFNDWFAPASCRSYARSGACWTNTTSTVVNTIEDIGVLGDDNVIYNQVMRLIEAHEAGEQPTPQLILIAAGANDAWFVNKRPMAFAITPQQALHHRWSNVTQKLPGQVLTLAESAAYCSLLLHDRFPRAIIVFVSPAHATKVKTNLINQVGAILESTGLSLKQHTIRLDMLSPISHATEKKRHTYTYDGIHTNVQGAKTNGEIIVRSLESFRLVYQPPVPYTN